MRKALLPLLAAAGAAIAAAPAGAADRPSCDYTLSTLALTGPTATDVTLRVSPSGGCQAVAALKKIQLKTLGSTGDVDDVVNVKDVAVEGGAATIRIARVERGRRIEADVLVQPDSTTYALRDAATAQLRPDLVVGAVSSPAQTLTTRPVTVTASIRETNGDTAASAHVTLAGPLGPLAGPVDVIVPAGGSVPVSFSNVALTAAVPTELTVVLGDAAPAEYDLSNDTRGSTVDVTKDELARSRLLVDNLGGYGFQFNHHLYAPITNPDPATLPDLDAKVKALKPQMARVFYNENWEANVDRTHPSPEWEQNLESFKDVVQLADEAGADVVVAYQTVGAAAKANPTLAMSKFADVLQDLVVARGLDHVRWVEIQNEPNTVNNAGNPAVSLPQYEALYRALDAELSKRGLRSQIKLMAGDLVQNTEDTPNGHRAWFDYMVAHMNDVVDAWAEHIYWNWNDPRRAEERIKDVAYLTQHELAPAARKPTFIIEYGVRGVTSCGTKPDLKFAYYPDADCTDLRRMPFGAFQKLAFAIDAAQLGFDGASYWDLYWSTYDRTKANQSFWMIGPPEEGWALYPSYYAFQLLSRTTAAGWHVLGVDPWNADDEAEPIALKGTDKWLWDDNEQELAAYAGPNGELTIAGLDTNGRELVTPNGESSSYSIGGLPPNADLTLAVWNGDGSGTTAVAGTIHTGPTGVARFDVPLQAAFVLTSVPMS